MYPEWTCSIRCINDIDHCRCDFSNICIFWFAGGEATQRFIAKTCGWTGFGIFAFAFSICWLTGMQEVVGAFSKCAWHNNGGFDPPACQFRSITYRNGGSITAFLPRSKVPGMAACRRGYCCYRPTVTILDLVYATAAGLRGLLAECPER